MIRGFQPGSAGFRRSRPQKRVQTDEYNEKYFELFGNFLIFHDFSVFFSKNFRKISKKLDFA